MVPFLLVFHMRSERIDLNLNIGYHPGVPFFHHEISRYFVSNHCQNLCGRGGSLKRYYFPDLTPFIIFTAVGCMNINFLEKIILLQIGSSTFAGDLKSSGLLCVISREIKSNQGPRIQVTAITALFPCLINEKNITFVETNFKFLVLLSNC